jgi:hypothetical protein
MKKPNNIIMTLVIPPSLPSKSNHPKTLLDCFIISGYRVKVVSTTEYPAAGLTMFLGTVAPI